MAQDATQDELESRFLVGRKEEIAVFLNELTEPPLSKKIINLYGTAGIGKSFLLDEFIRLAHSKQALAVTIDCESFAVAPGGARLALKHSFMQRLKGRMKKTPF
ncbi:ATP-binding protein [Paenibacillus sp. LPE1-1-1.1]|uniref:ATP-binding protein n=1 Tax=Paenibacillus sp. LPE1-1-1.1 TaxID=3135230 RepID=UPI00342D2B2F